MLELQLAVAKCNKYATGESGDTVEVVELPQGGFCLLLADGQGSGGPAKLLSQQAVSKAIALLKDGMPVSELARAVHDYIYIYRSGKVSLTLSLVSVDVLKRQLQVSRNGDAPALVYDQAGLHLLDAPAPPLGVNVNAPASVTDLALEAGMYLMVSSDGLTNAGTKFEHRLNLPPLAAAYIAHEQPTAATLADYLLRAAVERDGGFPHDDISVAVLHLAPDFAKESTLVRRLTVSVPFDE